MTPEEWVRNRWSKKTRDRVSTLRSRLRVLYGDAEERKLAIGQDDDGRWWVRSYDERSHGKRVWHEATTLEGLEASIP